MSTASTDDTAWADASTAASLMASLRRLWGHLHRQPLQPSATLNADYLQEQVHELLGALPGRWLLVLDDAFADTVKR
ncbi:hypothetical protein GCM10010145_48580 [Streptomyces ruber]|uniref:Uncharacterized protein n=2 Tax=Streptomyces TaxID=1883 RepID=A0A918EUE3_9ACTN|nr:hypothetical protein GCM10010145_48580 [Streptomyces ruber]